MFQAYRDDARAWLRRGITLAAGGALFEASWYFGSAEPLLGGIRGSVWAALLVGSGAGMVAVGLRKRRRGPLGGDPPSHTPTDVGPKR